MSDVRKKLEFEYQLKYEESYETFYLLSMKGGKQARNILAVILTVIAVAMLLLYYQDSSRIHYFFIAILDIALLYYLIYVPALKAKKGAKKVSRQRGIYRIELTDDGKIRSGKECIPIRGDKDARVIETERIFAIRPDRLHTFCLPKRILREEEIDQVRKILKEKED